MKYKNLVYAAQCVISDALRFFLPASSTTQLEFIYVFEIMTLNVLHSTKPPWGGNSEMMHVYRAYGPGSGRLRRG
jgi:hypothetical protein